LPGCQQRQHGEDEEDSGPATGAPVYGTHANERLAALKRGYEQGNIFRLNHNIVP